MQPQARLHFAVGAAGQADLRWVSVLVARDATGTKMETTWNYYSIIGYILGLFRDNGKMETTIL